MKRYLNRKEKNDFYVLSAFLIFCEDLIKNWIKAGKDKELLKNARTCKTYAGKVATALVTGLDDDEKTQLLADCSKHTVAAVRRNDYDQLKKRQSILQIEENDLRDITDFALVVCQTCQETKDQVTGCRLRELLMKYMIPPFDECAAEGVCQYKIPDFKNRRDVIKSLLKGA